MEKKERFKEILSNVNREGIDKLLEWLETTDFYKAPASRNYHGACEGGLLEHSLCVYDQMVRTASAYPEIECDNDNIALASLLHDLCKVNFYIVEQRNRKNKETGQWESYDCYQIDEKFVYGSHGGKSVYLAQHFIELKPIEAVAINCHMGAFDNQNVGKSYEKYPFAWLLHIADEAATYIDKK